MGPSVATNRHQGRLNALGIDEHGHQSRCKSGLFWSSTMMCAGSAPSPHTASLVPIHQQGRCKCLCGNDFPSNAAINSASFLSKDLQKRELDLIYRVVDEADNSRAIKVSDEQVGAAIGPLLASLSDGELAAMESKAARDKDIEVACSAAVKYLGALSRLPLSTKARTFRIVNSSN